MHLIHIHTSVLVQADGRRVIRAMAIVVEKGALPQSETARPAAHRLNHEVAGRHIQQLILLDVRPLNMEV